MPDFNINLKAAGLWRKTNAKAAARVADPSVRGNS
jgi:hypothetical protein